MIETNNQTIENNIEQEEAQKVKEPTIGQILKKAREDLNISIDDVGAILKIKNRDILALEQDDILLVASHLYIPGFIKSYGKLLKIDSELIDRKVRELNIDSNVNNKKHRLNISKKNVHSPNSEAFFNAILVFTVLYLLLFSIHQFKSEELITTQTIINEFEKIN